LETGFVGVAVGFGMILVGFAVGLGITLVGEGVDVGVLVGIIVRVGAIVTVGSNAIVGANISLSEVTLFKSKALSTLSSCEIASDDAFELLKSSLELVSAADDSVLSEASVLAELVLSPFVKRDVILLKLPSPTVASV